MWIWGTMWPHIPHIYIPYKEVREYQWPIKSMIVIGSNTFNNGHSSFTTIDLLYMVITVVIVTPLTMVCHASLKMSMLYWRHLALFGIMIEFEIFRQFYGFKLKAKTYFSWAEICPLPWHRQALQKRRRFPVTLRCLNRRRLLQKTTPRSMTWFLAVSGPNKTSRLTT